MAELVKIPVALAEYQARFERPHIAFIGRDLARAFEAVFAALSPFNLLLADTEIITIGMGKPADHKAIFRIPKRGISFEFGAEEYKFSKEGVSWKTTEEDGQILHAAECALLEGSDVKVKSCSVIVAMHLRLLTKSREEILAPFIPEPFKTFMTQRQAWACGTHLKFAGGDVLLDFSEGFADGIFLRFSSHFNGHPSPNEILAKVRSDQSALFGILGVEEATNV